MSVAIKELKQLALMQANAFKQRMSKSPEYEQDVLAAYTRAFEIDDLVCPVCLVDKGQRIALNVWGSAKGVEIYFCGGCESRFTLSASEESGAK